MAGGAVIAEQPKVAVVVLMAGATVQRALMRGKGRMNQCVWRRVRRHLPDPCNHSGGLAIRRGLRRKLVAADFGKCVVIHWAHFGIEATMLVMAILAVPNVRVKCSWLALQKRLIISMTDDAIARLNTGDWRVAGVAVMIEKRMGLGQLAGIGHALPLHDAIETPWPHFAMTWCKVNSSRECGEHDDSNEDGRSEFHGNQRSPK